MSLTVGLCLLAGNASAQQKLYRWVDKDGIVHYGDSIPPEFANRDRTLMNEQGVPVGFEEGEITAEERAAIERQEQLELQAQLERESAARRDRMLLDTYLTVSDIEDLRDRRLELIDSQIKITQFYLGNLRRRLESLESETIRFAPHNTEAGAQPVPEYLALDISRTQASISLYEQRLNQSRREQDVLKQAFALDIDRFKELKGG